MSFTRSKFTGFPFDDIDSDSNSNIQDRLNDIAQRHPEFASHLKFDEFPSLRRNRQGSGSSSARRGGGGEATRPTDPEDLRFGFPSRFSGFSRFPFSRHFEDDFTEGGREDRPPESPKSKENRSRKPNPNLPQHLSNTVDLGQKQPPVQESRSQRSMSAPPENRSTPTASRVDTEQQQSPQEDPSNMGKTFSRQPPKERIIPIHVEGRDEPVVPSNPKYAPPTAAPETMFGGERIHTGFASNPPDPQAHMRSQMYDRFMPQREQQYNVRTTPPRQAPSPQQFAGAQPAKQQTPPPGQRSQTPPPKQKQATPPPPTKHYSNDPLDKIKGVKNDVLELMTNVEKFQGTRKDKDYLYLDEMLTLNLIKLDDVETDGKENIRAARKEAIKCIQTCINNLEAKAQAKEKELKNLEVESPANNMQVDQPEVSITTESSAPKFTSQATLIIGKPQEPGSDDQAMESSPSADASVQSTAEASMESAETQIAPSEEDTNTSQISTTSKSC